MLEGPFFGARKPHDQSGSKLRTAANLLILGRATIEEGEHACRGAHCTQAVGAQAARCSSGFGRKGMDRSLLLVLFVCT